MGGGYGGGMGGYGGGMGGYGGGMGGMYGSRYGGGMGGMGGGMYGGGMGGQGMLGNSTGFLEKMSQYVYSLCEIGQLVEMNANGLNGFFTLLKNMMIRLVSFSKDWGVYLILGSFTLAKFSKNWTKK
jgi:hypothetical protein